MNSDFSTGRCVYPLKEFAVTLGALEVQSAGILVGLRHAHVDVSVAVTLHFIQGHSYVVEVDLASG